VLARISSFKRILVPVDFSLRSANALAYAVALGSTCRAEIEVLHVWHSDLATPVTLARERAKGALRDFVAGLELQGDAELRRRIEHGDPYLTIQRTAQLGGHDLVVVAGPGPGRSDADTVARRVLSSAANPVLVVPMHCAARHRSERERVLRLERILVPVALAGAELSALAYACELAEADGALVEALLGSDATNAQLERFRSRPQSEQLSELEVRESSELAAARRAQASRFDLIVMSGKRARVGEQAADLRPESVALSVPCASLCLPD
jgi:nucleotide-binding universal stress UspA family protein